MMTDDLLFRAKEKIALFKRDLFEYGPLIEDKEVNEVWSLFCNILESFYIDYACYWYNSNGIVSDTKVYKFGTEDDSVTSEDEKKEFLMDWEELPISHVEKYTDGYDFGISSWLPIFSPTPEHKAGIVLIIGEFDKEDESAWKETLIDLSLLIELVNSRVVVKNSVFAENVEKLTPKQYEVLKELGNSKDRANAAAALGIAVDTYDNHLREIKKKLRTKSAARPSLERIRTNYAKFGTAGKEYLSLLDKALEDEE